MEIKLNIDTVRYTSKPKKEIIGNVKTSTCRATRRRTIDPEQLLEFVQQGLTFTPAEVIGSNGKDWQSQQVIVADIDNAEDFEDEAGNKHKRMIADPLTPDRARQIMAQHGIEPYFMYWTFSRTESWPKFRVVLILEEPLTDQTGGAATATDYTKRLAWIFNRDIAGAADTVIHDPARIIFGGRPDCVFYTSHTITPAHLLQALPEPPEKKPSAKAPAPATRITGTATPRDGRRRTIADLNSAFFAAERNFDLESYIASIPNIRRNGRFWNPCPVCGHRDDFVVTRNEWRCFGASGDVGGGLIKFLQHGEHLSEPESMEKAKKLLGFDPDEWRQAYLDAQKAFDRVLDWDDPISDGPADPGAAADQSGAESTQNAQEATDTEPEEPAEETKRPKPDNTSLYIDSLMSEEIKRFRSDKSTGFPVLDKKTGGLYSGLYVLAAISSLGKTTLALQIADQLAAAGHDVLYFSLEQSRLELVCKSLARITAQEDPGAAVNSLSIRKGYLPRQVLQAVDKYKEAVADRLSIVERNFTCNVTYIGKYIREYIKHFKTAPVVFVDYLQILQPADDGSRRQTTKETVDSTVTELKRLSRELDLTVVLISSVNRQNYLTPFDFESLKESGNIEYTADVVWGLQLQCLNEELFDRKENIKAKRERVQEAKAANPRKVELLCVKNRYGVSKYSVYFDYFPANDLFTESVEQAPEPKPQQQKAGKKLPKH